MKKFCPTCNSEMFEVKQNMESQRIASEIIKNETLQVIKENYLCPKCNKHGLPMEGIPEESANDISMSIHSQQEELRELQSYSKLSYAYQMMLLMQIIMISLIIQLLIFINYSTSAYFDSNVIIVKQHDDLDDQVSSLVDELRQQSAHVDTTGQQLNEIILDLQDKSDREVYKPIVQEEIRISHDFKTKRKIVNLNNTQVFDTSNFDVQIDRNASAIDVQLIWCSQQISGQLALGLLDEQPSLKQDPEVEQKQSNNTWTLLRTFQSKMCQTSNEKVMIKDGRFEMQSNGVNQAQLEGKTGIVSERLNTDVILVIKGYQVKQDNSI